MPQHIKTRDQFAQSVAMTLVSLWSQLFIIIFDHEINVLPESNINSWTHLIKNNHHITSVAL